MEINTDCESSIVNFFLTCEASNRRNVCIIAHVDHGKTSLCDYLISTNGILNSGNAGHVRYLDSREDEQRRLITMKASWISLAYTVPQTGTAYVVNLVDCPGHVDFSYDISSSVHLADGALLLIDVVEGIRSQTKQVAEIAYNESLKFILVLNKMDKLFTQLQMSPQEIFNHVSSLLDEVNHLFSNLNEKRLLRSMGEVKPLHGSDQGTLCHQTKRLYFSPELGNVIFASAHDGWAFDIQHFATHVASKNSLDDKVRSKLTKSLWGSYYLNKKTWSVSSKPFFPQQVSMVVQFIFQPIWKIYQWTTVALDIDAVKKAVSSLGLNCDLTRLAKGKTLTKAIFSQWMPLEHKIFDAIIHQLPSPVDLTWNRIHSFTSMVNYPPFAPSSRGHEASIMSGSTERILKCIKQCRSDSTSPVVLYVVKFVKANLNCLILGGDSSDNHENEAFVGLTRLFSGILKKSDKLFLCDQQSLMEIGSRQNKPQCMTIDQLYIMQGIDLLPIEKAFPGSLLAIYFKESESYSLSLSGNAQYEDHSFNSISLSTWKRNILSTVHRSLTLSSDPLCPSFRGYCSSGSLPLISVRVEPQRIADFPTLLHGLVKLYKVDPSIDIDVTSQGEILLKCCGEVHLQKCRHDLEKLFSGVPIQMSSPIVTLRECLYGPYLEENINEMSFNFLGSSSGASIFPSLSMEKKCLGTNGLDPHSKCCQFKKSIKGLSPDTNFDIHVSAEPFPGQVLVWLEANGCRWEDEMIFFPYMPELNTIQHTIEQLWNPCSDTSVPSFGTLHPPESSLFYDLDKNNSLKLKEKPPEGLLADISTARGSRTLLYLNFNSFQITSSDTKISDSIIPLFLQPYLGDILSGFRLASYAGPLTEEPVVGVVFTVWIEQDVFHSIQRQGNPRQRNLNSTSASPFTSPVVNTNDLSHTKEAKSDSYDTILLHKGGGQLISWIRDACRGALLQRGRMRIFEAMLHLEIVCDQAVLGKSYTVLSKRHCHVVSEQLNEGMSSFKINAFVPTSECFGLVNELRSKASGHIELQVQFSHWQMNNEEPFPKYRLTNQSIKEEGLQALKASCRAQRLIYEIRKRKGLPLDEKVVVASTKQRTLTRNK